MKITRKILDNKTNIILYLWNFKLVVAPNSTGSSKGATKCTVKDFLSADMKGKIILSVTLSSLPDNAVYKVYKANSRQAVSFLLSW